MKKFLVCGYSAYIRKWTERIIEAHDEEDAEYIALQSREFDEIRAIREYN